MKKRLLALLLVGFSLCLSLAYAADEKEDDADAGPAKKGMFMGVANCKKCHTKEKADEAKSPFKAWSEEAHSKAFTNLTDPAKAAKVKEYTEEMAKKTGKAIEKPQESDACLKCHTTGHGAAKDMRHAKLTTAEGVSCEACHGGGGGYYKNKTMKDLTAKKIKPEDVGLVMPTEKVCKQCHNSDGHTQKAFNFDERAKKIKHPIMKAAEKKAN